MGVRICGMLGSRGMTRCGQWQLLFLAVPQGPSGLGFVCPPSSFSCKEAQRGVAICFPLFCEYRDWFIQRLMSSLSCSNKNHSLELTVKYILLYSCSELYSDFPLDLNPNTLLWPMRIAWSNPCFDFLLSLLIAFWPTTHFGHAGCLSSYNMPSSFSLQRCFLCLQFSSAPTLLMLILLFIFPFFGNFLKIEFKTYRKVIIVRWILIPVIQIHQFSILPHLLFHSLHFICIAIYLNHLSLSWRHYAPPPATPTFMCIS